MKISIVTVLKISYAVGFCRFRAKTLQIPIRFQFLDESIINLRIQSSLHYNPVVNAIFAKLRASAASATRAQPLLEQIVHELSLNTSSPAIEHSACPLTWSAAHEVTYPKGRKLLVTYGAIKPRSHCLWCLMLKHECRCKRLETMLLAAVSVVPSHQLSFYIQAHTCCTHHVSAQWLNVCRPRQTIDWAASGLWS